MFVSIFTSGLVLLFPLIQKGIPVSQISIAVGKTFRFRVSIIQLLLYLLPACSFQEVHSQQNLNLSFMGCLFTLYHSFSASVRYLCSLAITLSSPAQHTHVRAVVLFQTYVAFRIDLRSLLWRPYFRSCLLTPLELYIFVRKETSWEVSLEFFLSS